jgi:hypothetical protein
MKSLLFIAAFFPGGLFFLIALGLMFCVPVLYAMHKKGDVRVLFSRGKTSFELVAKEPREAEPVKLRAPG